MPMTIKIRVAFVININCIVVDFCECIPAILIECKSGLSVW